MIVRCDCPDNGPAASYQTRKYGKGKRVGTGPYGKGMSGLSSRCTICGMETSVGGSASTKKGKK